MIHVKAFENWEGNVTDNVIVNYGNQKPKYSDIVEYTEKYIEENFDKITQISIPKQYFSFKDTDEDIRYIMIKTEDDVDAGTRYYIYFSQTKKVSNIDITKEEYDYLFDFMKKSEFIFRKNKQKRSQDNILSELDPLRRTAKKYNL
jgi:hypothetical protein